MADFEEIIKKQADADGNIPASAIGALVTAIKTAVGNEFVDKSRYKAKLDEIDELKTKQQTAEDNATTAEKWKTKYDALKDEFSEFKENIKTKEAHGAKEKAYRELLKENGVSEKRLDVIMRVSSIDDFEIDENGKIKDADKVSENIKKEWSEFITTTTTKGANPSNPPANGGGSGSGKTKEEILAIKDGGERRKAMAENPELFGLK